MILHIFFLQMKNKYIYLLYKYIYIFTHYYALLQLTNCVIVNEYWKIDYWNIKENICLRKI